jgi:hypothetical protein
VLDRGYDGLEYLGLVDARLAVEHGDGTLEAHAGVDVLRG